MNSLQLQIEIKKLEGLIKSLKKELKRKVQEEEIMFDTLPHFNGAKYEEYSEQALKRIKRFKLTLLQKFTGRY